MGGFDFIPLVVVLAVSSVVTALFPPENLRVRRGAFIALWLMQAQYLVWRVFGTMPEAELSAGFVYASLLLFMELISAQAGFKYSTKITKTLNRSGEADCHVGWYGAQPPRVDIFIPSYNEAWSIIERTLVGALHQSYPNTRVWLCDDGRRTEIEQRCGEIGVGYLKRDDNAHAKAGNMNSALRQVMRLPEPPEFIAVLDADFIPRRDFLTRTMALMHAEDVGIVQTPQYHYNPDPLQSTFRVWKGWPDQQRQAFNVILPAFDARGAAYCCGTSFLARTKALLAIDGFPTESLTEDVLTTIKMGMKGFRTVFLREQLTTGLAPEGLDEYMTQRGRWSLGSVQIGWWLLGQKPGATLFQKLNMFEGFVRWGYMSLVRVIWMLVPIVFWYTGLFPMECRAGDVIWFSFSMIALDRAIQTWISRGTQLPLVYNAHQLLTAIAVIPGTFKGIFDRRSHKFSVTDKGRSWSKRNIHWTTVGLLGPYAAVLMFGVFYRLVLCEGQFEGRGELAAQFIYVGLFWTVINLLIVFVALGAAHEMPRRRAEERYDAHESALVVVGGRQLAVALVSISVSGALLEPRAAGELAGIDVSRIESISIEDVGQISARFVNQRGAESFAVEFLTSDVQRRALIRKIFCGDRYVHPPEEGLVSSTVSALVRRVFA